MRLLSAKIGCVSAPYEICYAEEAEEDIRGLRAFDQNKVMDEIEAHLTLQPTQESKSRIKAVSQPFWSQYRFRVDDFRVYFDVAEEEHAVNILRVLKKGSAPTPQALS